MYWSSAVMTSPVVQGQRDGRKLLPAEARAPELPAWQPLQPISRNKTFARGGDIFRRCAGVLNQA